MARRWTADNIPDQGGKTVVVTGANSGLGLRSAEALAAKGAKVVLACRNPAKAEEAAWIVQKAASGPKPQLVTLDLASLESVRQAAEELNTSFSSLDVLINNAGVMAVPRGETADGFETQFGVNHLGHFALTGLLLPALLRSRAPRVVTVSSNAHWGGYGLPTAKGRGGVYLRYPAYAQSKLANLLFTAELQRRAESAGVQLLSAAAHPGLADTHLFDGKGERSLSGLVTAAVQTGMHMIAQPDSMGALPQLYAATMPDVRGNTYLGPYGPVPPLQFRGYPDPGLRSPLAHSRALAHQLWEQSESSTGVTYDWDSK
ncbi:oxidoreductase [Antrihabitans sp. YC2-6]|uniref:oxidoreductase n=1 Tax=Antrihabitans sp. YC2-6 TaxID=2799498 RepID=UPI0018F4AAC4|nr:oxidoreductase [Antrihabitans sp. YC2-6]MBJ8346710.1 SDR family NAD(P)-dependent oxidoreductase [Antrihabitans sp. YC2-6]